MIKSIAFLLLASACFGQVTMQQMQPFFSGSSMPQTPCQLAIGTGFPTNIAGYAAYTWWVAQCGYTTNAGVATLTDFSGNGLNLTQVAPSQAPKGAVNTVNGFTDVVLGQTSPQTLTNLNFTVPSGNLCEFWCVMSYTNISGKDWLIHDVSAGNTQLSVVKDIIASGMYLGRASTFTSSTLPSTNKYIVYNFVFTQGANATIYTNNTQGANVNVGSGSLTSIRLSGGPSGNNGMLFSWLEGGCYRTNLTAAGRLALYQYCTNKYALAP